MKIIGIGPGFYIGGVGGGSCPQAPVISRPLGKGSCALTCPYSENAIFHLLFLSTLDDGSDKLSMYMKI